MPELTAADKSLPELKFDNSFLRELPADPEEKNFRRQVRSACYSRVKPTAVQNPTLAAHSPEMAAQMDLPADFINSEHFARVFGGNALLDGMDPYAMCYAGHQFGNWAGQLGDGRAINLGELINADGIRYTVQLKGAGPTPYSRSADGLAVLRSSIREFLCSEAMYHLGIPTTRALSLVTTGEQVLRDMFYDGNVRHEPGAVVCRVATSFIRFGNFEMMAAQSEDLLRRLVHYTIRKDYPDLAEQYGLPSIEENTAEESKAAEDSTDQALVNRPELYLAWFEEVCRRTVALVIDWMRVGFVHGVMNTDNMSIQGLTIDYGPYGWLEGFDLNWTPNTTDAGMRRYSYGRQLDIALWNLAKLGQALVVLFDSPDELQQVLNRAAEASSRQYAEMTAARLGLDGLRGEEDAQLFNDLFDLLSAHETDMPLFFRELSHLSLEELQALKSTGPTAENGQPETPGQGHSAALKAFKSWVFKPLHDTWYSQPDDEHRQKTVAWLGRYAARLEDGMATGNDAGRLKAMQKLNPRFVLRNWMAQQAIDLAEKENDFSEVHRLLEVLRRPYDEQSEYRQYAARRPEWARNRAGCSMLSCSS